MERTLHQVETWAIAKLDKFCDDNKLEWQPHGSKLRGIVLASLLDAYNAGREMEQLKQKQQTCKHDYDYNTTGSVCRWCGHTGLQCSSD